MADNALQPRVTAPDVLTRQRCFNHAEREAVARCPACSRFFCRECVTEHDSRLLCAACLQACAGSSLLRRRPVVRLGRAALALAGLLTAWLAFHLLGQGLLRIPSEFHDGTIWEGGEGGRR